MRRRAHIPRILILLSVACMLIGCAGRTLQPNMQTADQWAPALPELDLSTIFEIRHEERPIASNPYGWTHNQDIKCLGYGWSMVITSQTVKHKGAVIGVESPGLVIQVKDDDGALLTWMLTYKVDVGPPWELHSVTWCYWIEGMDQPTCRYAHPDEYENFAEAAKDYLEFMIMLWVKAELPPFRSTTKREGVSNEVADFDRYYEIHPELKQNHESFAQGENVEPGRERKFGQIEGLIYTYESPMDPGYYDDVYAIWYEEHFGRTGSIQIGFLHDADIRDDDGHHFPEVMMVNTAPDGMILAYAYMKDGELHNYELNYHERNYAWMPEEAPFSDWLVDNLEYAFEKYKDWVADGMPMPRPPAQEDET